MREAIGSETVKTGKPLLRVLRREKSDVTPFWLMRQAGRYLPEYRELRAKAGGFLDMVYNPDFAAEVTLQPLRRYGMDAAILFSDILVIPQALGQKLEFTAGEGPKLDPVREAKDLAGLRFDENVLKPVYETVANVRSLMGKEGFSSSALIGFAGAPWTVATYMVEGGSSREMIHVKSWAYENPGSFGELIDLIADATIRYLSKQVEAGAEVLQLFDSWAGVLDETLYGRFVIAPTKRIVEALNEAHPEIPIIGFPRGSGALYQLYAAKTGVSALGLDQQVPLSFAKTLQEKLPVQGNLDPVCLLAGGAALKEAAEKILGALAGGRFIFNLGHGVIKETPPEHVAQLAAIIREGRA